MLRAALESRTSSLFTQIIATLKLHSWFLGLIGVYLLATLVVVTSQDLGSWVSLSLYSGTAWKLYGVWILGFCLGYPIYVMVIIRPRALIRYLIDDLRDNYLTLERLLSAGLVLVTLPLFVSVITSMKSLIPDLQAYSWDPIFAEWDRLLHGGMNPWEILQPILGTPYVTSAINVLYNLWFFLLYAMICWLAFSVRKPQLRMQFLLSFLLTWALLGNLAATVFASGGPPYYGRITGLEDSFAPLFEYLRQANEIAPVWALKTQEMLWDSFQSDVIDWGRGISAMPSMHVSLAVLFALVGRRQHKVLGLLLTTFAVIIMVGSVHLGWHYAIDGYASIAATLVIWWVVGWALKYKAEFRADPSKSLESAPSGTPQPA